MMVVNLVVDLKKKKKAFVVPYELYATRPLGYNVGIIHTGG